MRISRVTHSNTSINLDLRPNPTVTHYWHVTISNYDHRLPQCLSMVIYIRETLTDKWCRKELKHLKRYFASISTNLFNLVVNLLKMFFYYGHISFMFSYINRVAYALYLHLYTILWNTFPIFIHIRRWI